MIIGLIGLPGSGKTTVFNALTGWVAAGNVYAEGRKMPNLAAVEVRDERVDRLAAIYSPRKVTRASVDFIDFAGLSTGAARGGTFSSLAMGLVKNTDAIAMVVRNFEGGSAAGPLAVLNDIAAIEAELFVSDMIIAERRLEKIAGLVQRGQKDARLEPERRLLEAIRGQLEADRPILEMELGPDDFRLAKSFHFLTQKPLLVILNSDEARFGKNADLIAEIEKKHAVVEFAGSFEMELARMDPDAAQLFREDMGIGAAARDRLVQRAYATVGYISFFTVGEDEVRAWNLVRGATAVDAAAAIHNDLARGFIRAETFSCDDLFECGSEKGVREKGRLRLEGKGYPVRDGDIMCIRANV